MECNKARATLYRSEYPELLSGDVMEARRHLRDCRECSEFLRHEAAFGKLLRVAVTKEQAPGDLTTRILAMGDRGKRRIRGPSRALAFVAAVLLVAVGLYVFSLRTEQPSLINRLVDEHLQFLPSTDTQIRSSDPGEITGWFRGKVDVPVTVPSLSARLTGGRLCFLQGKRLALLFYELDSTPLSLFITAELDTRQMSAATEVTLKGRRMRYMEDQGYTVLIWQDGGLTYALVSALSVEEIQEALF